MTGCTIALSNGLTFTRTFVRDPYRKHQINVVSNSFDNVLIHASDYSHDLLSRRTNIIYKAQTGTNMLSCVYNARSEVTGVTIDTNDYAYIYDNIGNSLYTSLNAITNAFTVNNLNQYKAITNLLDLTGYKLGHDADGNTVSKGGDMVDTLHFWFSTKYLDHDTGLYYYGYRYYSPMLQRWINRDPIGEEGGHNLFLACYNNLINLIDNLGLSAAFYAKGKGETLFHLAAEEQYVERYYYSVGDALKNKNNSDYWGAIRKGELPVKVFTLAQLLEESGQVEIYAHGVADGGEIREVGGDVKSGVNSSRLKNELTIGGGGHKLTSLWSLTCRLGLRGGAQEFANILKIPVRAKNDDSLLKVLPYVDFTWSMKLSFWKKQQKNDIIDTFTELGNNARAGLLSYEGFRNEWKKKTDQYRKQGCIKGAYWHVRETTGNFVDYSPK